MSLTITQGGTGPLFLGEIGPIPGESAHPPLTLLREPSKFKVGVGLDRRLGVAGECVGTSDAKTASLYVEFEFRGKEKGVGERFPRNRADSPEDRSEMTAARLCSARLLRVE